MKHFIERFAEATQNNWHKPAVCDYHGETFYYADVATQIAKLHIVFERLGVKVGDKIAISANNTAHFFLDAFFADFKHLSAYFCTFLVKSA